MTPRKITKPGLYPKVTFEQYLADPVKAGSLTRSAITWLLPPSTPARFKYLSEHPQPSTKAFDFGSAAHRVALGDGQDIVEVKHDDWRTKDARAQRDEAYAEGKVPLLSKDVVQVYAMAEPLLAHPLASILFDPDLGGKPEMTAVWLNDEFGVWQRARYDWLPEARPDGRLIIPDYKTAETADPEAWARKAADYGYHRQARWYSDGALALGLAAEVSFVFVVQEKDPPYQVNVMQFDMTANRIAASQISQALRTFRACTDAGSWPSYPAEIHLVSLPPWVENRWANELSGGDL